MTDLDKSTLGYKAYLSLGSNMKSPSLQLEEAIRRLQPLGEISKISSFYETEPMEVTDQPWFVNCALELRTRLNAKNLMRRLLEIERKMGRTRTQSKGPRNIDIDLLLFDDQVIDEENLRVPHPAMQQRRFVLAPLAEIAPEARHPLLKITVSGMLHALGEAGGSVRRLKGQGGNASRRAALPASHKND